MNKLTSIIKRVKLAAFWRNIDGFSYAHTECLKVWQSKNCAWNWIYLRYGIRRSDVYQVFPVWNMSNNNERSLLFGFGFWHITLTYHRKESFNQDDFANVTGWERRLCQLFL
jgi:hypothetical protein